MTPRAAPIPATLCEITTCRYKAVPGETWRCVDCLKRFCDCCGSKGMCHRCRHLAERKAAHEAFLEVADKAEADERYVRRVGIFSGVKV